MEAPRDIRRFETAQLILMVLALVSSITINHQVIIDTLVIAIFIGLTFLVTRARVNWARWALLAIYVVGVAVEIWTFRQILEFGHPVIVVTSVATLTLAFTPQSSEWLRTAPQPA